MNLDITQNNFKKSNLCKNTLCDNCGLSGHDYRGCKEPITSWGIILVKTFYNPTITTNLLSSFNNELIDDIRKFDKIEGIKLKNISDFNKVVNNMDLIKFLLVRRKHSLGYTEFIRGNYKKDNIDGIIYLFQQMTPDEIQNISKKSFPELWDEFWADDVKKKSFNKKQFTDSKENFDCLKNKIDVELDLNFYVKHVKPFYVYPEWGFPKGRKQRGECDLNCAIREFCEETGYSHQDIKIIKNVKPIIENMTGTNGISYRFIYYLAEDVSDNIPMICDKNNNEIGDIGFYTYNETLQMFREYHIEKRNIAKNVFMYYLDNLIEKEEIINSNETINETINNDIKSNEKIWPIEFDDF